jgi:uncharacterized protein (DUF1778 family)
MDVIRLAEEEWEWFMELLDREPQDCPKLRALFQRPSPFEEV